jgi:hypothetical protein
MTYALLFIIYFEPLNEVIKMDFLTSIMLTSHEICFIIHIEPLKQNGLCHENYINVT